MPPKPNEFDRKASNSMSTLSGGIRSAADASSGFSKLMFGAMNPFCIIRMEYMTSLAPAIHISCPVMDLVEATYGLHAPKTSAMALASFRSPTGVEVA